MDKQEHKLIHLYLHKALDELMADYLVHTGKFLSKTTVMELAKWSYDQTKNPTPDKDTDKENKGK